MRTNIVLDEVLVDEAFRFSRAKSKRKLIHQALEEFVEHHHRKNVLEFVGKVKIAEAYDHKALRACDS
ncbi:MAG: type II toxin-antitoxin system VapB family antitoxin [Mariprofundaceae bacterium]|nr:type II toxin-antitoxin system VapB family antitoxin [Mariprofundaceae bacterium]